MWGNGARAEGGGLPRFLSSKARAQRGRRGAGEPPGGGRAPPPLHPVGEHPPDPRGAPTPRPSRDPPSSPDREPRQRPRIARRPPARAGGDQLAAREEFGDITDKIPPGFKPVTKAEAGGSAVLAVLGLGITGGSLYFLFSNLLSPEDQRTHYRADYRPENQPGRVGSSSYPPRF